MVPAEARLKVRTSAPATKRRGYGRLLLGCIPIQAHRRDVALQRTHVSTRVRDGWSAI